MAYFKIFISLLWYGQIFSNFIIEFFNFFHFPLVVWPIFFQNSKTKNFKSNFKNEIFSIFSISNFPWGSLRLPNLLKNYRNYLFTLKKNSYILNTYIL
jgi:hypothetical protein